jgi:hypothetical protein
MPPSGQARGQALPGNALVVPRKSHPPYAFEISGVDRFALAIYDEAAGKRELDRGFPDQWQQAMPLGIGRERLGKFGRTYGSIEFAACQQALNSGFDRGNVGGQKANLRGERPSCLAGDALHRRATRFRKIRPAADRIASLSTGY